MNDKQRIVRIGGASGFWGDSSVGAPQLVRSGQIDYLVFDYLAELTMSILAGARLKKPELGYATDFVSVAMKAVLKDVVKQGIRVVSNAGGVNPQGCADALAALAVEQGIALKIAVVRGDDVSPLLPQLRQQQPPVSELQSGAALPERVLTANAYLGARPIQAALDAGAQVVITGRCVDSAVTLGVLMHEFKWQPGDFDLLAAGSLAGHIIECGCQATGGLHTDWDTVPDWPNIGYPIVECSADGSFVVTKPAGTGGKLTPAVVGEQMLYEIGDPAAYLLPDVVADFTQVRIAQAGEHRVRVHGARGHAPTASYKVSATYVDGFKTSAQLTIVGFDAVAKARRTGEAILARTGALFAQSGFGPYSATHLEVLGAESCYGPHAQALQTREAVLRLAVTHPRKDALELFAREVAPAGTSWAPGTTGAGGGRASVSPSIRQYAFLLDKSMVEAGVTIDGERIDLPRTETPPSPAAPVRQPARAARTPTTRAEDTVEVPLIRLAWARSGDKGDTSNIGVIARHPALLELLREQLSEARVAEWLSHLVKGRVTRYDVPGIGAFNFVCEQALGGGGMASLRNDPLGKGMGQILLAMPLRASPALLALLA
ncbi:acyclic terpene utilization AtuA family protein [Variovorax sp. efr-133-TYG-130]|uniref:acyclic terpene utilization AtuA family protein n=1 Tax=Variovorax sp. efr-133-TYG-130 TaxID=3040327 RepID=UPI002554BDE5|nr:acyclic terpene utilization AtuA family protein [Variovorax sp. efr-133-TYG-130]